MGGLPAPTKLLQALGQQKINLDDSEDVLADLPLPAESDKDLDNIERQIGSSSAVKKAMFHKLSMLGGRDLSTAVINIFQTLMTNKCALEFSFHGKKKKLPLKRYTNLVSVINRAVQANPACDKCLDDAISRQITEWLKHAKSRCRNGDIQERNVPETETDGDEQ